MSRRIAVLAVAATVLLATLGAPLALASPTNPVTTALTDGGDAATDGTAANQAAANETPPGQKLAGVIGVQGTETDGELERRTFETRLEKANSNASKAVVVAGQVDSVRERLTELEQRKAQLEAARENGSISEGRYRVQMTTVVATIERTKSMLNRTSDAAATVPAEDLRANGVDTAELETLRESASNLTGPEVAEIARGVAGDNPGKGLENAKKERAAANETTEEADNRGSDAAAEAASGNASENRADKSDGASHAGQNPDAASGVDETNDERDDSPVTTDSSLSTDDTTTETDTTTTDDE